VCGRGKKVADGFPPASAWTQVQREVRGRRETGLAVAATLRRIGLWAVESAGEGRILLQARELSRFVRAAERWASLPHFPVGSGLCCDM
jgi:hypothetical protein